MAAQGQAGRLDVDHREPGEHELRGFGTEQCLRDMDSWGYSFREGSARAWFEGDGNFARAWLFAHGLIDAKQQPINKLRRAASV